MRLSDCNPLGPGQISASVDRLTEKGLDYHAAILLSFSSAHRINQEADAGLAALKEYQDGK